MLALYEYLILEDVKLYKVLRERNVTQKYNHIGSFP